MVVSAVTANQGFVRFPIFRERQMALTVKRAGSFDTPDGVHEDKEAAAEANTRPFNVFANTLG